MEKFHYLKPIIKANPNYRFTLAIKICQLKPQKCSKPFLLYQGTKFQADTTSVSKMKSYKRGDFVGFFDILNCPISF